MNLSFRLLTSNDFPLLLDWLSRPHVKEWWDAGEETLEVVAQNYGEEEEGLARFILLDTSDGREKPLGYFQHYAAADGSIGIDQFIGEEDYLNRGIGQQAIRLFVEMIMREQKKRASIILDPQPENKRAIRCYEKVGFRHYETKRDENGTLAYMMRLDCLD